MVKTDNIKTSFNIQFLFLGPDRVFVKQLELMEANQPLPALAWRKHKSILVRLATALEWHVQQSQATSSLNKKEKGSICPCLPKVMRLIRRNMTVRRFNPLIVGLYVYFDNNSKHKDDSTKNLKGGSL